MNEAKELENFIDNIKILEVKEDDYKKGLRLLTIGNKQQRVKAFRFLSIKELFTWNQTLEDEGMMFEAYMDVNDMKQLNKWDYR